MTKEEIKNAYLRLVNKHLMYDEDRALTPDMTLYDAGADSLDEVEIVMAAEVEFGIEIDDEDAQAATTLEDQINLIHKLTEGAS